MKHTLLALLMFTISAFAAETINLSNPEIWSAFLKKRMTFEGNEITIDDKGLFALEATPYIDVDPNKSYTISATITNLGEKVTTFYMGFRAYDAKGAIQCQDVHSRKDSFTTLAQDAKKGDNFIIVKDASKWDVKNKYTCVAFNAKEDFSDMPNRHRLNITKIEKLDDDTWKITLVAKLNRDFPADTGVRQHINGGYIYTGGQGRILPGETKVLKGTIKGIDLPGNYSVRKWPIATTRMRPIFLGDYSKANVSMKIVDFKVEIE